MSLSYEAQWSIECSLTDINGGVSSFKIRKAKLTSFIPLWLTRPTREQVHTRILIKILQTENNKLGSNFEFKERGREDLLAVKIDEILFWGGFFWTLLFATFVGVRWEDKPCAD